jgi:ArsR family transcriptional regulator
MISTQPQSLLSLMDSLGDPARLRILRLVERQELGVAELCEVLQMPQSTVSRHLKLLSDSGWTRSRRDGTTNLYRISADDLAPPARRLWLLAREQTAGWSTLEQDRLRLERVLSHRAQDTHAFFASAAGQWDQLRQWLYGRGFDHAAILGLLPADWVVADLGCGTGHLAAELAPHVKRVIGVDQSAAMLRAARKITAQLPNVELRRGDLAKVPIETQTCDAALISLVLTYVDIPGAGVLGEAARILKPGGRLVVIDLLRHDREDFRQHMGQRCLGFDLPEIEALLARAGFADVHCTPLPPEPEAKGPALFLATGTRAAT